MDFTEPPADHQVGRTLDLYLELSSKGGRRVALESALRSAIREGRLRHGSALPSTRALASDIGVSRSTVVAAYEQLAAEGYLQTRRGAATMVAFSGSLDEPDEAMAPHRGDSTYAGDAAADDPGIANPLARSLRFDFHPGRPDVHAFPRRAWMSCARRAMHAATASAFDYPHPQGVLAVRSALAAYLARVRGMAVDPGDIAICAGFLSAASALATHFTRTGHGRIAVEDPMLFLHRWALEAAGVTVVPIQVDSEGISVDALARLAQPLDAVLVTPARQYPLGMTMSSARRTALIEWARHEGVWIIEDDYDAEFRYDGQPVGALQGLAPDRVVHVGTASKTLAPGLRLGWMTMPRSLRLTLPWTIAAHGGVSTIEQLTMAEMINTGAYDRHIRSMRSRYRRRRDRIIAELSPIDGVGLAPTTAGLSICVRLDAPAPSDPVRDDWVAGDRVAGDRVATTTHQARDNRRGTPSDLSIEDLCAASGVGVVALSRHYSDAASAPNGLVIGFGALGEHQFDTALSALTSALTNALVDA